MDDLMDFAIGSVVTCILVYVFLSVVGMMVLQAGDQLDLSTDEQSELERTASNSLDWLMFTVNTPGKEAITILMALLGGFAHISRNHL